MDDRIKVHVVRQKGRTNLVMRYVCPDSGKQVCRSTGTSNQRKAEREAAKWEAEVREGRYSKPQRITWQEFRDQYDVNVLDGMRVGTAANYSATLNVWQRTMRPGRLAELTTAKLTAFVTTLREQGLTPATIARHLRQLKVAARWAHRQGLLNKLPAFDRIKQAKGAKGRAVTLEEFERMLAAIPKAIGARPNTTGRRDVESWQFYLRGLWASGLRLTESLLLRWDDATGAIVVDDSGRHPMFRIPAESEKGNTHRLLPMAPELAELLATVPADRRRGRVFLPLNASGEPYAASRNIVGPIVSEIGAAARVIVGERRGKDDDGNPATLPKYASAHDLRRAFGFRWSRRVMPPVLKELMRHTDVSTTMTFYVGTNAQATADELWRVAGIKSGITDASPTEATLAESSQVVSQ